MYIFGDWSGAGSAGGGGRLLAAVPPPGHDLSQYPSDANRVTADQNMMWTTREVRISTDADGQVNAFVRGFSEDQEGEVYVMVNREMGPDPSLATGEVLKLVAT